jgi:hypothetical protein
MFTSFSQQRLSKRSWSNEWTKCGGVVPFCRRCQNRRHTALDGSLCLACFGLFSFPICCPRLVCQSDTMPTSIRQNLFVYHWGSRYRKQHYPATVSSWTTRPSSVLVAQRNNDLTIIVLPSSSRNQFARYLATPCPDQRWRTRRSPSYGNALRTASCASWAGTTAERSLGAFSIRGSELWSSASSMGDSWLRGQNNLDKPVNVSQPSFLADAVPDR